MYFRLYSITSFYLYRRLILYLLVSQYFFSSSTPAKFPQTEWESSPFENIGPRAKWNILILFIWKRMHCFQIWGTTWHATGDTNDPGGLGHSSSPWKLCSNSCDFCYALAFTREMNAALCFLDEKNLSVKWAVCCQRLLGEVSSLGSPSESLLKECPTALPFLQAANIPDGSLPFLGNGFSFPRMKLQQCVPSPYNQESATKPLPRPTWETESRMHGACGLPSCYLHFQCHSKLPWVLSSRCSF